MTRHAESETNRAELENLARLELEREVEKLLTQVKESKR